MTEAHKTVVQCEDVCFSYAGDEVLHNVSFEVRDCEMVAIVGPNGGGKTTLLKLILGLIQPRFGRVRVFGCAPRAVRPRIGYVPQYIQVDKSFPVNVTDVVQMGRVERHWAGPFHERDRAAVEQALHQVEMWPYRHRLFADLSGGERQRVLVAQALATDPELLLLDEPTAGVDAAVEQSLFNLFKKLNETRTLLIVSHNLNVVMRHVTHVLCVNRTVAMHPMAQLSPRTLEHARAGNMAMLQHDMSCHVFNAASAMKAPHHAEDPEPEGVADR